MLTNFIISCSFIDSSQRQKRKKEKKKGKIFNGTLSEVWDFQGYEVKRGILRGKCILK